MRLVCDFEMVDMGNEIISVPVGDGAAQVHGVLKLNSEGQEIFNMLKEETTEEKMIDILAAKYENDRITLTGYVHAVLDKLRAANLLDE